MRREYLVFGIVAAFLTLNGLLWLIPEGMNPGFFSVCLMAAALALLAFLIMRHTQSGNENWATLTNLFLLGFIIVHFQLPLMYVLGFTLPKDSFLFLWASEDIANKAVGLSVAGLLSFLLGWSLAHFSFPVLRWNFKKTYDTNSIKLLFPACLAAYCIFLVTSGDYVRGVYDVHEAGAASKYSLLVFNITLIAALALRLRVASRLQRPSHQLIDYFSAIGWPLVMLTSWHIVFSLYVGDRGPVITFGLLLFSVFFYRVRPMSLSALIIVVVVGSLLFTLVKQVRVKEVGAGYASRVALAVAAPAATRYSEEEVPLPASLELAYSMRTLNHSLARVPSEYSFGLGYFQMYNITGVIPGLSGIFYRAFGEGLDRYHGSSGFVSYLIQGETPRYGDGTSVIADAYLDFGMNGAMLGLFIFGAFVARSEKIISGELQASIFWWVAGLIFFSVALYVPRSSVSIQLQKIFLIYAVIRLNTLCHIVSQKRAIK